MPAGIVAKIHWDAAALTRPAVRDRLDELGLVAVGNRPAEFAALVPREILRMQGVLKPLGLRAR